MKNTRNKKSGQAFIEYLLFVVMITGIMIGVMFPAFRAKMLALQDQVYSIAQKTISQDEMGIPNCWFFCGDGGSKGPDGFISGLKGGGTSTNGVGKGTANAGDEALLADSAASARGRGGNSSGSNGLDSDSISGRKGKRGGGGAGPTDKKNKNKSGFAEPEDIKDAPAAAKTEAPAAKVPVPPKENGADLADQKSEIKEDGVSGAIMRKRAQEEARRREGGGGCQDLDFWTVIKMLIIIVIVILGAIMAMTNRKGKDQLKHQAGAYLQFLTSTQSACLKVQQSFLL